MAASKYHTQIANFKSASYTAIISDLHLCEAEEVNQKYPLWKKYKTAEFFFDDQFVEFLERLEGLSQGETIELVLNGDIFDFDSVTSIPEGPPYRVTWLETKCGLSPQEHKSLFKIRRILQDHEVWIRALQDFLARGHRVIFVIGNHDIELHFSRVQDYLLQRLTSEEVSSEQIRFVEWFYISNKDTLIEHGHQYDPYCMSEDPVHPFIKKRNSIETKIPFGNLATRFLINGMGFFNPHADSNYLMSAREYVIFFFRYIVKAQPFLMLTWFFGSTVALYKVFRDRLRAPIRDPLTHEDKVEHIAQKANATPRMVRELQELFVDPASSHPLTILRELWLDRAFLAAGAFFLIFQLFVFISAVFDISFFWMFIPLTLFLPFFIFYSRNVGSEVTSYKEPRERILNQAGMITQVQRIVYGHTHVARHEMIGAIEHLNCGTWSPAFEDVECKRPYGQKNFVWIKPGKNGRREATLGEL